MLGSARASGLQRPLIIVVAAVARWCNAGAVDFFNPTCSSISEQVCNGHISVVGPVAVVCVELEIGRNVAQVRIATTISEQMRELTSEQLPNTHRVQF